MSKLQQIVAQAKQDKLRFPNRHSKWTDYIKAASAKMRSTGERTALNTSVGKVKKTQTGTSNKKIDKRIQAKPVGKRKAASKDAKKPFYYEYRANRTDKGKLLGIGAINKDLKSKYNGVLALIAEQKARIAYFTEKYKQSKPKSVLLRGQIKKAKDELILLNKSKLKLSKFK